MTDPQPTQKPRSRRMLGFYVAMGAALALFVGGWFAWTPLHVGYWERKAQSGNDEAIDELLSIGPAARPALERLLRSPRMESRFRIIILLCVHKEEWTLPLAAIALQDPDPEIANSALMAVQVISDKQFADARAFLEWWNREGKAKYGRGE